MSRKRGVPPFLEDKSAKYIRFIVWFCLSSMMVGLIGGMIWATFR